MAIRIFFLVVVYLLPMMVTAIRPHRNPLFYVKGRVFCDPCRAGFETSATTYIAGAEVILQCKDKRTNDIVFSKKVKTDSSGSYKIFVEEKQTDQICDAKVVSSPQLDCKEPTPGRDQSRVILNRFNGIATNDRFVNNFGFMKEKVAPVCAQIFKHYRDIDYGN